MKIVRTRLSGYDNWTAFLSKEPIGNGWEVPLWTDAMVCGGTKICGPYAFHNTIAVDQTLTIRPAIILRYDEYIEFTVPHWSQKTDTSAYHGGGLADEIAALASLCLGIRLKAGGPTREFEPSGDPKGRPIGWFHGLRPSQPHPRQIVVAAPSQVNLDALELFSTYANVASETVPALVRAARLHQDALWIANSDPSLSWILFASAVEAAAGRWRGEKEAPIERLRAARPELAQLLNESGGASLEIKVSELIVDTLGSTKKFVDFLMHFLPDPLGVRPHPPFQLGWHEGSIRKAFAKVYDHRSQALHNGIPFPAPMCWAPENYDGGKVPSEVPTGLRAHAGGATWDRKDTPMMLHVFAHIVRGALTNWWRSLVAK